MEGQSSEGRRLRGLEARLARELIRLHPDRAASVLDQLAPADTVRLLAKVPAPQAAAAVASLTPHKAAGVLEEIAPERAAEMIEVMELDVGSRLYRRLSDGRREAMIEFLSVPVARSLQSLLRFPENTAGGLMDPAGLSLPEDLTVREALARIRELPEQTRYDLYVVNREQVLVGVLNLRELLLARPQELLSAVMVRGPLRLRAQDDRSVVISHPGWKKAHALPVVDEKDCYIGVVRYRTLRQLEAELLGGRGVDANTSEALGELFAAGAGGVLDALTAGAPSKFERKV